MSVLPFPEPELDCFDEWWNLQFHKTQKTLCKAKWEAITSPHGYKTKMMDNTTGEYVAVHLKASPQEILDATKRQNKAFFEKHGYGEEAQRAKQFVRRPAQWLNQGGFDDD